MLKKYILKSWINFFPKFCQKDLFLLQMLFFSSKIEIHISIFCFEQVLFSVNWNHFILFYNDLDVKKN